MEEKRLAVTWGEKAEPVGTLVFEPEESLSDGVCRYRT